MLNYIYRLLTWGCLLLGLAGSGAAGYWMKVEIDKREYQQFIHYCEEIKLKIAARLEAHEQILLGGAATFDVSDTVTRQEWHTYVERLLRNEHFNGIQGLGFALWIPAEQLAASQARIRAEGFPDYKVFPDGERDAYAPVVFLEPFTERNLRAFGYDMYAEPIRQAAIARARDENIVTLSGKVSLIQETDKNKQAGTLMSAPVYQKNKPIATVEQRRAALFGWVYSPFRMTDLLNNIVAAESDTKITHVHLHVYDGRNTQTEHLLYDNHPNPPSSDDSHHSVVELDYQFNGVVWTLQFEQVLSVDGLYYLNAWLVFGAGVFISLLLFLLSNSYLNMRANALKIANQLTRELQESEQRFHLLADSAPVLIWLSGLDKLCYQFNKVWLDFTGRTLAQELGNGWLEGVHADDLQHSVAIYSRSFDARLPFTTEYRLHHCDGEYRWLLDTGEPRFAEDGTFLGYIGSCVDISDRKTIEEKLEQQHALLNNVINSLSHPFYVVNTDDYTIALANQNSGEWLKGETTCYQLSHKQSSPCDTQDHPCPIKEVKRTKQPLVVEHLHYDKKGEQRMMEVFSYPIFNKLGEVHQIIEYAIDITERKQAELKIANSLSLLSATLESSNDAILVVDLNNAWVLYNQKFIDLWHIPNDIITCDDDTASLQHYVLNQLEDGNSFLDFLQKVQYVSHTPENSYFDIIKFKDGKIVERNSIPQHINNKMVGRVWSFRDITQRMQAEQALQKESEKNLALLRNASDGIHILNTDGNLIELSDLFCHRLGYSRDEMLGMNVTQWDVYFSHDECIKAVKKLFKNVTSTLFETSHRCKDGTIIDVEVNSVVLELGGQLALFNSSRDITYRKQIEEELAVERIRLAEIIKATNVGTWEWNVQTGETHFNDRWATLLGYTLVEIAPTSIDTWLKFSHPDDLKRSNELLEQHFNGQTDYYVCESRMKHKQGHWVWILDRGRVSSWTSEGKPLLMSGTHQDITERKAYEKTIQQLAFYDPLTDLPNRRKLHDRLEYAIALNHRANSQFAVFMMDLDKFKAVNDKLGHLAGDKLLKQVATRVTNCLRKSDMVARLGGDEFVLVLENLKFPYDAKTIALKVIADLALPFQLSETDTVQIGVSIGISLYPQHGNTAESLMDHADTALYQAKDNGRNCFVYFSEVSSSAIDNV